MGNFDEPNWGISVSAVRRPEVVKSGGLAVKYLSEAPHHEGEGEGDELLGDVDEQRFLAHRKPPCSHGVDRAGSRRSKHQDHVKN